MAKRYNLSAEVREDAAGKARHNGLIPAVLYGHGLESQSVQVDAKKFQKVFSEAGSTSLVTITIGETDHPVLIREVQYHSLKGHVLHADFYQVRMDEEIHAEVPLTFAGESSAVKDRGGVFVRNMDTVEVEALPADLPHDIEVDISTLATFDDVITVASLKLPEGVTVLHEAEEVIALVQEPKSQEEIDADLAEEVTEDVSSVEGTEDKKSDEEEGQEGQDSDEESKG